MSTQICPVCAQSYRTGEFVCQHCGANLLTGQPSSMSTRYVPKTEITSELTTFDSAVAETMRISGMPLTQPIKREGTSSFESNMVLNLQIEGYEKPLFVRPYPNLNIVLGRGDTSASQVDVDLTHYSAFSMGVSRRHAAFRLSGSRLDLYDLDSSNGTFLNGTKLIPHQRYQVADGSEITLGQLVIMLWFKILTK